MNFFRRSDESFVELVHDEEKRAAMLDRYRTARKTYSYLFFLFLIMLVIAVIGSAQGSGMFLFPVLMSAVMMTYWADLDGKIKLILCIEEMQRNKQL